MRQALGVILLFVAGSANAIPVVWNLNDVTFDDGGIATGVFTYDADGNAFSSVAITTSGGTYFGASQLFTLLNPDVSSDGIGLFLSADADPMVGTRAFNFNLDTWMTNVGGTIAVATAPPPLAFETACARDPCTVFNHGRVVTSGTISAVPVPAAVWLFGSALAGLGWFRRKA
jgi:hypothetical protein